MFQHQTKTIGYILRERSGVNQYAISYRLREFRNNIADEAEKRGLEIRDFECPKSGLPNIRKGDDYGICGFIFSGGALARTVDYDIFLDRMSLFGKPLSIMDDAGIARDWTQSRGVPSSYFSMAEMQAGQTVGKALLEAEHQNCAFFTHNHNFIWSRRRLDGLQAAQLDGKVLSIQPFLLGLNTPMLKSQSQIIRPHVIRQLIKETLIKENINDPEIESQLLRNMQDLASKEDLYLTLQPLFELALKSPKVTVWVCANDVIGENALAFLQRKKKLVPAEISVVAFDDSPSAKEKELTSFNFGFDQSPSAMIDYIIENQATGPGPFAPELRSLLGRLVQRKSFGKCMLN